MVDCCSGAIRLICTCFGAADLRELNNRTAGKLPDDGFAHVASLTGCGVGLSGYAQSATVANIIATVAGYPTAYAKTNIERIAANPASYNLTFMGLGKGNTPTTDTVVCHIANRIKPGASTQPSGGTIRGGGTGGRH